MSHLSARLLRKVGWLFAFAMAWPVFAASPHSPQLIGDWTNPSGLVYVEPTYVRTTKTKGIYKLVPYRERRAHWGGTISVGYSAFNPTSYLPYFSDTKSFSQVYSSTYTPLMEIQFSVKRNFSFGSFGLEIGVGGYYNKSTDPETPSQLTLIPARLGFNYVMDTLFSKPYFAPYISGGAYVVNYKETETGETQTHTGNTQPAPYFAVGALFDIGWLDRLSATEAYEQAGIQSTSIYIEARKFVDSWGAKDPIFETSFQPDAGLRVEF